MKSVDSSSWSSSLPGLIYRRREIALWTGDRPRACCRTARLVPSLPARYAFSGTGAACHHARGPSDHWLGAVPPLVLASHAGEAVVASRRAALHSSHVGTDSRATLGGSSLTLLWRTWSRRKGGDKRFFADAKHAR